MCLRKLARFKPCKIGYKVMYMSGGNFYGEYYSRNKPRKLGAWLHERGFRDKHITVGTIDTDHGKSCPRGWHIIHRKDDALGWLRASGFGNVCVKVSVREPLAVGYQGGDMKVTIAKQIKILRIVE